MPKLWVHFHSSRRRTHYHKSDFKCFSVCTNLHRPQHLHLPAALCTVCMLFCIMTVQLCSNEAVSKLHVCVDVKLQTTANAVRINTSKLV